MQQRLELRQFAAERLVFFALVLQGGGRCEEAQGAVRACQSQSTLI